MFELGQTVNGYHIWWYGRQGVPAGLRLDSGSLEGKSILFMYPLVETYFLVDGLIRQIKTSLWIMDNKGHCEFFKAKFFFWPRDYGFDS